jgi:signal transduction histidine kinase/ActR/RegA family two-component response regulator
MKLKTKFTLIVSVFVVILLALVAFSTFSHYKKSIKETIAQQQFRMVSILADEIDNKLLTAQQNIASVAKTAPPDIMQHPEKAQAFLDNMPSLHSMFDNHVFLFTPTGQIFVESPYARGRRGFDASFREYIINTLKTRKPYISDPYESSQSHKHPAIMLTIPLFDSKGQITGILAGGIDLMRDNFLGRIGTVKIGETGNLYLYDAEGTMIIHPDKTRILVNQPRGLNRLYDMARDGFEGTGETTTSYGVKSVSSFKKLKTKNWILAANSPQAEVYRPIRQAEQYLLLATVTGLIAIFFIISYIVKYLIQPLELFTRHIEELPQKTGDDRFLNIKTKDEIGILSLAFNKMETERKQAEDILLKNARLLSRAEEVAGFGNWEFLLDENKVNASEGAAAIYGLGSEEWSMSEVRQIALPEYRPMLGMALKDLIERGITYNVEFKICRPTDGKIIDIHSMAEYDAAKNMVFGVIQDITERMRAEKEKEGLHAQLLQAQKMESVGRLAGGVAHDFNNMLGVILGHTELAMMQVNPEEPINVNLNEIREAANRSADLTRQLLAFARRQTVAPKVLDLNDCVTGILKMLKRLIGEEIDLTWMPGEGLWLTKIDPAQIDQLLANLCVNARDAITGVGKITIETRNTIFDRAYCAVHQGFVCGEYVMLAVSDNGCGMNKDVIDHLFEPFFTTKEVGRGTGLGLATVYGIVKQNDGFINVYSEVGVGTTFKVYLPRFTGETIESTPERTSDTLKGSGETVLLVEDEAMILQVSRAMLEELGYTVLIAGTPSEALSQVKAHGSEIQLLITDVIMPEMNGRELVKLISEIKPGLKYLFTSGYTANVIAHHGVLNEGTHFLQKPFSMKDLSHKVREALERK